MISSGKVSLPRVSQMRASPRTCICERGHFFQEQKTFLDHSEGTTLFTVYKRSFSLYLCQSNFSVEILAAILKFN